jgi:hypothetical protein
MGTVAIGTLKTMRANQPLEAQQRMDAIVKQLEKRRADEKKTTSRGQGASPINIAQPMIDGDNPVFIQGDQ